MFTGIVETTAEVLTRTEGGFVLQRPALFDSLHVGQSIACNGTCLTLTAFDEETMAFDIVPETFARTNLDTANVINLERALAASGRFEGHVVLGHIDTTAELLENKPEGAGRRFKFSLPETIADFAVAKGSITVNGVSLTIAACGTADFEIAVIPTTLQLTNLGKLEIGDRVNLEADYFAKLLRKWHS